jgi:hypothetical protein
MRSARPGPEARGSRAGIPRAAARATAARRPAGGQSRWPLAVAGAILLALIVVGHTVDVTRYLEAARSWAGSLGVLAPVAFVAVYVAATLIGVPGVPFTLLSPFLFGAWPAVVMMIVASGLSAAAAFLVARYLARDAFMARLTGTASFARLSALLEAPTVRLLDGALTHPRQLYPHFLAYRGAAAAGAEPPVARSPACAAR